MSQEVPSNFNEETPPTTEEHLGNTDCRTQSFQNEFLSKNQSFISPEVIISITALSKDSLASSVNKNIATFNDFFKKRELAGDKVFLVTLSQQRLAPQKPLKRSVAVFCEELETEAFASGSVVIRIPFSEILLQRLSNEEMLLFFHSLFSQLPQDKHAKIYLPDEETSPILHQAIQSLPTILTDEPRFKKGFFTQLLTDRLSQLLEKARQEGDSLKPKTSPIQHNPIQNTINQIDTHIAKDAHQRELQKNPDNQDDPDSTVFIENGIWSSPQSNISNLLDGRDSIPNQHERSLEKKVTRYRLFQYEDRDGSIYTGYSLEIPPGTKVTELPKKSRILFEKIFFQRVAAYVIRMGWESTESEAETARKDIEQGNPLFFILKKNPTGEEEITITGRLIQPIYSPIQADLNELGKAVYKQHPGPEASRLTFATAHLVENKLESPKTDRMMPLRAYTCLALAFSTYLSSTRTVDSFWAHITQETLGKAITMFEKMFEKKYKEKYAEEFTKNPQQATLKLTKLLSHRQGNLGLVTKKIIQPQEETDSSMSSIDSRTSQETTLTFNVTRYNVENCKHFMRIALDLLFTQKK